VKNHKKNRGDVVDLFEHLNYCINSRHGEIGELGSTPNPFHRCEDGLYDIFRNGRWFRVRVVEIDGEEP
jgi:hypothetical protein